jgi:sugar phosphate isomerase/epimerase
MSDARFTISAFGDEIAVDLAEQLRVMQELKIGYLELRAAWGKNVVKMEPDDTIQVKKTCQDYGIRVSCLGSPVGKSPLLDPIENEVGNLTRLFRVGEAVGTRNIRVFSFYPPDTTSNTHYDQHVEQVVERLGRLAEAAEKAGFYLLLENEKGIVGDTPQRCHAIVSGVNNQHLCFLWDPANFIQVDVKQPLHEGWALLESYTAYIHIKDAVSSDKKIRAAGEGDGQIEDLLVTLKNKGYQGFLALEPHLTVAGHSSGFSGPEGMAYAVRALRTLMAKAGCEEADEAG